MEEQIVLNKYGRMRLNYLKEHEVWLYEQMLMNGTLSSHLEEIFVFFSAFKIVIG